MANEEQIRILRSGVDRWNDWRTENQEEGIDLRDADLVEANLGGANLIGANLTGANLTGARR